MRRSLAQRLTLVFALLLIACSVASAWLQIRASDRYEQEVIQRLSRDLARQIVRTSKLAGADGLALDPIAREARLNGTALDLTPREFDLLYFLMQHPDEVFSRMQLLDRVWGYRHDGYEHTVNTHINRLRTKVEVEPGSPKRILTVWGRGYKFAR